MQEAQHVAARDETEEAVYHCGGDSGCPSLGRRVRGPNGLVLMASLQAWVETAGDCPGVNEIVRGLVIRDHSMAEDRGALTVGGQAALQ